MSEPSQQSLEETFLSLPYRDRQLVVVTPPLGTKGLAAKEKVRISDYHSLEVYQRGMNPRNWLKKSYWTDTKTWGLYGYVFDRFRGAGGKPGEDSARDLHRVPADVAERIASFPPGHPLYDTVYVGHPLKPSVYTPLASFHHFLFEEKFNELLKLLWSLSAKMITINCVRGYQTALGGDLSVSVPSDIPVKIGTSLKRDISSRSEAVLEASFTPTRRPHIPESMAWYSHEPTWQKIAEARLTAGLKTIDVELHYDDDFGVNGKVAASLLEFGFKIGGDFEKHEQTVWKFHGSFI